MLCIGQKKQTIYFMLHPKYFASGLNPAIFRKQRVYITGASMLMAVSVYIQRTVGVQADSSPWDIGGLKFEPGYRRQRNADDDGESDECSDCDNVVSDNGLCAATASTASV